jgi:hypothetical protein
MSTFLIREDPVQVDRWLFRIRTRLAKYKDENKALQQEVTQLRNRPDTVYDPPKKKDLIVRGSAAKINMAAPVEQWNTHHYIRLFQDLFQEKYGSDHPVRGGQWKAYALRIKQFRDCHEEVRDNQTYKEMIEWLFKHSFNKKFIASIPLITSDAMLYQWMAATRGQRQTSPEEFKKIAAQAPKTKKDVNDIIGSF